MIHKFPRFVLALTTVLFIGTVATLRHLQTKTIGVEQDLWILLGIELGCFLCICLCAFRETALLHNKITRQNKALEQMVRHDDLTHCLNRRALFEILHGWERSQAESNQQELVSIACLMIDIDHFKRVNDEFGHASGDAILKKIVEILDRQLQGIGAPLTRYGGEEFCIVLTGYSMEESQTVADRLRLAIERASETAQFLIPPSIVHSETRKKSKTKKEGKIREADRTNTASRYEAKTEVVAEVEREAKIEVVAEVEREAKSEVKAETKAERFSDISLTLSISIGIARWSGRFEQKISIDQLLNEADQALYQAKHSGRNAVCSIEVQTNSQPSTL